MAVRVRYKIIASVSSTSAEEKDLANQTYEIVSDGLGEGGTVKTLVAASASLVAIQMPQIASASLLIIRTNAKDPTLSPVSLDFRRNSTSGEIISVAPLSGGKEGHMLLSTAGLTSLYVSNTGSVDMEVTLILAGD